MGMKIESETRKKLAEVKRYLKMLRKKERKTEVWAIVKKKKWR